MGAGFSQVLFPCFNQAGTAAGSNRSESDVYFTSNAPLDGTLGHSFCYVRSSARSLDESDRFLSPTSSLRFDDPTHQKPPRQPSLSETGFRAISGASVSANSNYRPVFPQADGDYDEVVADGNGSKGFVAGYSRGSGCGVNSNNVMLDGFESTSSFSALPLQRVPRGGEPPSGPLERAFFMSGPIERGAVSGPLDGGTGEINSGGVPFSAPLGGMYVKRRKKRTISGIRKALSRNFSVVPVRNFINGGARQKDESVGEESRREVPEMEGSESNEQWALGKAGEDRVHVVVSEELGWLFVGIYDGFNGPDAPEFLMNRFYKAMYNELDGLFWDTEDMAVALENAGTSLNNPTVLELKEEGEKETQLVKKVTFGGEEVEVKRRRLWEFLVEDETEEGLDLSGSDRFAFSVDDALSVNSAGSAVNRRSLLLSKLKNGLSTKHKEKEKSKSFPWRFWLEDKHKPLDESKVVDNGERDGEHGNRIGRKRKVGVVDHDLVLSAMCRALQATETAYSDMTYRLLKRHPELAMMGSCILVALMRDEDVYVMNLGDSRAIVAQHEHEEVSCDLESQGHEKDVSKDEGIVEESVDALESESIVVTRTQSLMSMKLTALQLSTDHSTSIEEEVTRIKSEHPDDSDCIVNHRVKGRLTVTRAFGAGFLKQKKLNDVLLEMFRNDYIGTAPYISCSPSLRHHRLCPRDQFLVLSSDGLYQYFSNQEVVTEVQNFLEMYPDGDPAQHLIEELLSRAAKKAGMDFHELLDIPQGDRRRKYHDDVTVMVVSLEGRIWKSSGKYL